MNDADQKRVVEGRPILLASALLLFTSVLAVAEVPAIGALFDDFAFQQLLTSLQFVTTVVVVTLVVVIWRQQQVDVTWRFKITHLLPAMLQVVIFAYWFAHWPTGRQFIPTVTILLVLSFPADMALSVLARGTWRAGAGPLPVVLSTYLLAQYSGSDWWMGSVGVFLGLATKHFVQRDGRPVFNPSAVGLMAMAILDLGFVHSTPDFAHEFASPPNIVELVLVLALIVQLRVPIVLVTLAASLTLVVVPWVFSLTESIGPVFAPVTVVLCLLITDPSTMPKTQPGRVLFGVAVALGMVALQAALFATGHSDFWSKVAFLPVVNLLALRFDAWGGRMGAWLGRRTGWSNPLDPKHNRFHVALWFAFALLLLLDGKGGHFDSDVGGSAESPCYVSAPAGRRCETNSMFCTPFSVVQEARCWMRQ